MEGMRNSVGNHSDFGCCLHNLYHVERLKPVAPQQLFGVPGRLLSNRYQIVYDSPLQSPSLVVGWYQRKEMIMAIFEFSDGFDAVGFYTEQYMRDEDFDYYHEGE
jgi:hypothetical protein